MSDSTARLAATLAGTCPIVGVSVGKAGDSATVRIDFDSTATASQKTAAQNALAAFDWSDAAHSAWEDVQYPMRASLRLQAVQAIADMNAYAALANPTVAQTNAYSKRVAQTLPLILRRLAQFD